MGGGVFRGHNFNCGQTATNTCIIMLQLSWAKPGNPASTKSRNSCDSCTHFAIEIWSFNRRLTDTLRYQQHEMFTCFWLLAAITQPVYHSEGK